MTLVTYLLNILYLSLTRLSFLLAFFPLPVCILLDPPVQFCSRIWTLGHKIIHFAPQNLSFPCKADFTSTDG